MRTWKVGGLAKATGLTVRTLHHYNEVGLLSPSHRTEAGHRVYTERDVLRLQQVVALRSLGFSLEQIGQVLSERRPCPALEVVRVHAERLREQVKRHQQIVEQLDALAVALGAAQPASAEQLFQTIKDSMTFEAHYAPDEIADLHFRAGSPSLAATNREGPKAGRSRD
jgi:DNA-binding transcriptional MerR regulator